MEESSWQMGVQVWSSEEVHIRDRHLSSVPRWPRSQKGWPHLGMKSLAAPVSLTAQPALFTQFHIVPGLWPPRISALTFVPGASWPPESHTAGVLATAAGEFCASLVLRGCLTDSTLGMESQGLSLTVSHI